MVRNTYIYCPVYLTDGKEWICTSQSNIFVDECRRTAETFAKYYPSWAEENVLQRIGMFKLVEEKVPTT